MGGVNKDAKGQTSLALSRYCCDARLTYCASQCCTVPCCASDVSTTTAVVTVAQVTVVTTSCHRLASVVTARISDGLAGPRASDRRQAVFVL
jgi:hypothetical protein